jgi:MFS family permease
MIWGLLPRLAIYELRFSKYWNYSSHLSNVWGFNYLQEECLIFILKRNTAVCDSFPGRNSINWPVFRQYWVGTALVYPTFLSAIAQATTPHQRAESIGTFRLWRDLGYAIGAIISGITADLFGVNYAIILIGLITIASSVIIEIRMPKDN